MNHMNAQVKYFFKSGRNCGLQFENKNESEFLTFLTLRHNFTLRLVIGWQDLYHRNPPVKFKRNMACRFNATNSLKTQTWTATMPDPQYPDFCQGYNNLNYEGKTFGFGNHKYYQQVQRRITIYQIELLKLIGYIWNKEITRKQNTEISYYNFLMACVITMSFLKRQTMLYGTYHHT